MTLTHSAIFAAFLTVAFCAGCDNMQHQQNIRTFVSSDQNVGYTVSRKPPAHTVATGGLNPLSQIVTGSGVTQFPLPLTHELLERGRNVFNAQCATCHGEDGYGHGIVVRRGFPAPSSLHEAKQRQLKDGDIFGAITNGCGIMYSMADRVVVADRWAVVAYVRALQLSQHMAVAELSPEERQQLKDK